MEVVKSLAISHGVPAPASELRRRLREATRRPHYILDHHPILAPLIRSNLTVSQYGNALAALHGIYAQVEAWILAFLEQHPDLFDYRSRRKLPALESDLAALGCAPIPCSTNFTAPMSIGSLVGILYTLEGSALGGQFIARRLQQIPDARLPLQFFTGYGDLTHQRWEEFLQFADDKCPASEYGVASTTAASLFSAIKMHLDDIHLRSLAEIG